MKLTACSGVLVSAYWINPYSWGLRSLSINEFHSTQWNDLVLNPDDPTAPPARLGTIMLGLYDVYPGYAWVWYGVVSSSLAVMRACMSPWMCTSWLSVTRVGFVCLQIILLGYFVIMGILPVLCLTYLNPPRHNMSIAKYQDPDVSLLAHCNLF